MPLLDFTEMPYEDENGAKVDTFEQFARDFLEEFGFEVLKGPDRGADNGKDLIVKETRQGILRSEEFMWLVSCKHKAHSNKSVSVTDEQDIRDRIDSNSCDGFIGFYSTTPSSGLSRKLDGMEIDSFIYDGEKIEKDIHRSGDGLKLIERYFPESYKKLVTENPNPSNIFEKDLELNCEVCGNDLFKDEAGGVLALGEKDDVIEDLYIACKGTCDRQMEYQFNQRGLNDLWLEVTDFKIPLTFLHQLLLLKRDFLLQNKFTNIADHKLSRFLVISFQHVARNQTKKETERADKLLDKKEMLDYFNL